MDSYFFPLDISSILYYDDEQDLEKAPTKRVPVCGNTQRAGESESPAGVGGQGKSLLSCRAEPSAGKLS
jgi:hypothetical protein